MLPDRRLGDLVDKLPFFGTKENRKTENYQGVYLDVPANVVQRCPCFVSVAVIKTP